MKMKLHQFDLKLKHTFKIAYNERNTQKTLVVELNNGSHSGFGEATSNFYYGNTIEAMVDILEKNRQKIEEYNGENPEEFWEIMNPLLSKNSFAQCALDIAIHDLYGKTKGKPLYKIWNSQLQNIPKTIPISNYTIGIDSIENMVKKMQEFPWPIYKIKLGTNEDLDIIRELRKYTDAIFRVDANCAWGVDETIFNSKELKKYNVQFIEQPLQADDWEGMKEIYQKSELPLFADESCVTEDSIEKCQNHFHGVNIKLMKCGGLTPARRMIKKAKDLDMKVMIGCMTESSVGISAISQLLPEIDEVDMDGSSLLEKDIAKGPSLVNGKIIMSKENGTGVVFQGLDNEKVL
ncbi:MAG: dipeptide epimerase [Cyclobacteriaceae bacterium]|nr:dipeptide epimerase [Cyclobacteriaceae bacterium]